MSRQVAAATSGPRHILTDLPGVSLFEERRSSHHYRVWHETWYAFCVVQEGAAEIRYRRQTVDLVPDSVLAFVPGEAHETRKVHAPGSYSVLMVPAVDVHLHAELSGRAELQLPAAGWRDARVVAAFRSLCERLARPRTPVLEQQLLYAELLRLIVSLDERSSCALAGAPLPASALLPTSARLQPGVIRAVREYLLTNYDERQLDLAKVSRALGWSSSYVSRAFSDAGHCPPKTLLRLVRVEQGRRLLDAGATVYAAAVDAGFKTAEKFNQAFHTVWNLSPKEYLETTRPRAVTHPGKGFDLCSE